jgi:predicted anti-sigma-YlaC factor YlaD
MATQRSDGRGGALVSDYLDGTLGRRDHQRLSAHLPACPSCRAFTRTLGCTVGLLHQIPRVEMPGATRERLRRLVIAGAR